MLILVAVMEWINLRWSITHRYLCVGEVFLPHHFDLGPQAPYMFRCIYSRGVSVVITIKIHQNGPFPSDQYIHLFHGGVATWGASELCRHWTHQNRLSNEITKTLLLSVWQWHLQNCGNFVYMQSTSLTAHNGTLLKEMLPEHKFRREVPLPCGSR